MKEGTRGECLFCEAQSDIEEHHVVPRRLGGTNHDKNLIPVCGDCHKKLERVYDVEFYDWLGIRLGMTPNMMLDCIKELKSSLNYAVSSVEIVEHFVEQDLQRYSEADQGRITEFGNSAVDPYTEAKIKKATIEQIKKIHDWPGDYDDELWDYSYLIEERMDDENRVTHR